MLFVLLALKTWLLPVQPGDSQSSLRNCGNGLCLVSLEKENLPVRLHPLVPPGHAQGFPSCIYNLLKGGEKTFSLHKIPSPRARFIFPCWNSAGARRLGKASAAGAVRGLSVPRPFALSFRVRACSQPPPGRALVRPKFHRKIDGSSSGGTPDHALQRGNKEGTFPSFLPSSSWNCRPCCTGSAADAE